MNLPIGDNKQNGVNKMLYAEQDGGSTDPRDKDKDDKDKPQFFDCLFNCWTSC